MSSTDGSMFEPGRVAAAARGSAGRAAMMAALVDGTWRPAGELARAAGVAVAAARRDLDALVRQRALARRGAGHRAYYGLAGGDATVLHRLPAGAAPRPAIPCPTRDAALREARTCYGHLAGRLGVALCDAWLARGWVRAEGDWLCLEPEGVDALLRAGWSRHAAERLLELRGRSCIDWTERRVHIGGGLGKSIAAGMLASGWLQHVGAGRTVAPTARGRQCLAAIGVVTAAQAGENLRAAAAH